MSKSALEIEKQSELPRFFHFRFSFSVSLLVHRVHALEHAALSTPVLWCGLDSLRLKWNDDPRLAPQTVTSQSHPQTAPQGGALWLAQGVPAAFLTWNAVSQGTQRRKLCLRWLPDPLPCYVENVSLDSCLVRTVVFSLKSGVDFELGQVFL